MDDRPQETLSEVEKAPAQVHPMCECSSWDEGRRLGFIRQIAGGFALIGWRGTERLEEPEPKRHPDQKVHEARFQWCPWCGGRARKPAEAFRPRTMAEEEGS